MSIPRAAAVVIFISGLCAVTRQQDDDRVEMNCDPRVDHRFSVCPQGYCCVRDEFWPSWVYCRKMGLVKQDCTTRDTETNCPCGQGLVCEPNIRDSQSGVASLYGRCINATETTDATTSQPQHQSTPCPSGLSCEDREQHTDGPHSHEQHEDRNQAENPIVG